MTDFNMPPGCSVNDIPGNRPSDLKEEAFWELLDAKFIERIGEKRANVLFWYIESTEGFDELLYEYVNIARALEGQDAFNQGQQEAELIQNEIEEQILEQGLMTHDEMSKFLGARREILRQWKD